MFKENSPKVVKEPFSFFPPPPLSHVWHILTRTLYECPSPLPQPSFEDFPQTSSMNYTADPPHGGNGHDVVVWATCTHRLST
jgi:hypothetical protein